MILLPAAGLVLTIAVVAFILYPIVRPPSEMAAAGPGPSEELVARRDRVYGELRDLEFDFRVGKVTAEDYQDARNRLEVEAARVLQAIDTQVKALDDEIEREVRALRARPDRNVCLACGAATGADARFCAACGAPLTVTASR